LALRHLSSLQRRRCRIRGRLCCRRNIDRQFGSSRLLNLIGRLFSRHPMSSNGRRRSPSLAFSLDPLTFLHRADCSGARFSALLSSIRLSFPSRSHQPSGQRRCFVRAFLPGPMLLNRASFSSPSWRPRALGNGRRIFRRRIHWAGLISLAHRRPPSLGCLRRSSLRPRLTLIRVGLHCRACSGGLSLCFHRRTSWLRGRLGRRPDGRSLRNWGKRIQ
jgi:hypothetical protein